MKILLSIKSEYAFKILSGEKKYEYRKSVFKRKNIKTVVLYATKPMGKIVGEFDIKRVLKGSPSDIWNITKESGGVEEAFFFQYFYDKHNAYAIEVGATRKYKNPISPILNGRKITPPQNFIYL